MTPDNKKDDHPTPTKGKGKGGDKQKTVTSDKERKRSADRKKTGGRRGSAQVPSPPPGVTTPTSDVDVMR